MKKRVFRERNRVATPVEKAIEEIIQDVESTSVKNAQVEKEEPKKRGRKKSVKSDK